MRSYPVAENTIWLTGALVAQKVLSLGYFWYLSNQLTKATLGMFLFALNFATLFGGVTDLGLTPILIRETARDPAAGNRYLRNIFGLKLLLCAAVLGAASLVVAVSVRPLEERQLILLALGFVVMDAFTLSLWGVLKAFRNLRYESATTLVVQLLIIAGGVTVLATSRSPRHLVLTLVVASWANLALAALWVKRKLRYRLRPQWQGPILRHIVTLAPAFALSLVFGRVYNVADTVLLRSLKNNVAVANYAIPAKVVTSLQQIIPAAFAAVIFPVFTRLYRDQRQKLTSFFSRACGYVLGFSLPASFALIIAAPYILATVWPAYVNVTGAFRLMAAALPFIFLSFPTGYLLNACDRQRSNTINRGVMTAAAVAGNIALIPRFSFVGAAAVFLAANILLILLDGLSVRSIVPWDRAYLIPLVLKITLAALVMAAVLWMTLPYFHVFGALAAGAVAYLAVSMGLKTWPSPKKIIQQIRGVSV